MLKVTFNSFFILIFVFINFSNPFKWGNIDLATHHIPYYFNNNPELKTLCMSENDCPYKKYLKDGVCWGYEGNNCTYKQAYSRPTCPGHHKGWVNSKEEQLHTFFNQGDFGYVKQRRDSLQTYCSSTVEEGSSLQCSENMEFCRGKNIYMDFRDIGINDQPFRYSTEVFKKGEFSGHCRFNETLLKENMLFNSALQSWAPEMRYFTEIGKPLKDSSICDLWVTKPTIIAKIDASVSLYHHFCDFFNLYAALHVNNSSPHAFDTDTQVIIWETHPYRSNFAVAWKAFTKNPLWNLQSVAGKRVCLKNVMFPLLPRMVYGLYYNTPVIWGCERSGLFHAFSHHLSHRLRIPQRNKVDEVHVTVLSRQTKHRRILNENELIKELSKEEGLVVRKAEFKHSDAFVDQLTQDKWTDILVGMHGSGLTHLLFLPDWAVVFELYNCGDPNCYEDLARLRGLKYITWEDKSKLFPEDEGSHPELGAHEKFTNYAFDVAEFVRLIRVAAETVRRHPEWLRRVKTTKEEL